MYIQIMLKDFEYAKINEISFNVTWVTPKTVLNIKLSLTIEKI